MDEIVVVVVGVLNKGSAAYLHCFPSTLSAISIIESLVNCWNEIGIYISESRNKLALLALLIFKEASVVSSAIPVLVVLSNTDVRCDSRSSYFL